MVVLFIFNEGKVVVSIIWESTMNMYLIQLINVEISIENDTGKIVKENYETRSMRVIASSLSELISELKPSIIDYEV